MENEIKKLQKQIEKLEEFIENFNTIKNYERIHCRQCHSTNINLTQNTEYSITSGYTIYKFECKDCGFKENRSICHKDVI